jgi:hypothetical protein
MRSFVINSMMRGRSGRRKDFMRFAFTDLLACLAAGLLVSSSMAHAEDCVALEKAASIAQAKVPRALVHVMTLPGQAPQRSEMISIDEKAYTKMNGKWSVIPFSAKDQIDMINTPHPHNRDTVTCHATVGDPINGEPSSLMTMHESGPKTSDARMWISTRTGLPLRSEIRLGDGTLVADEFRYEHVQAPAGMK